MQQTLTHTFKDSKEIYDYLKNLGDVVFSNNEYVDWNIKGDFGNALMYKSGKFVLQSSDEKFLDLIREKFLESTSFEPHIGSDEVGKGDYFGPLVVCACYLDSLGLEKVKQYGVMDSKKLDDAKMKIIGEKLKNEVQYEVKIISPLEYNALNEKYKNVSIVLAKSHVEVIEKLVSRVGKKAKFVVIDQFSKNKKRLENEFKLNIPLKQFHHAESDLVVATASILARYFFLLEFEKMSEKYGSRFPLGATHVIPFGRDFVKKYGVEELNNVAKISFRTTQKITSF
jgi:ribonuclease HIII